MFLLADTIGLVRRPIGTLARLDGQWRGNRGLLGIAISVALPALIAELAALGPWGPAGGVAAAPGEIRLASDAFFRWLYDARFWLPLVDLVLGGALWVVAIGLIHLVARRLGGQGTLEGFLGLGGAIALTGVLVLPPSVLEAILRAMGDGTAADTLSPLTGALGLLAFVWQNLLLVLAAARHYQLPTERALTAVLGPTAGLIAMLTVLVIGATVLALTALGPAS